MQKIIFDCYFSFQLIFNKFRSILEHIWISINIINARKQQMPTTNYRICYSCKVQNKYTISIRMYTYQHLLILTMTTEEPHGYYIPVQKGNETSKKESYLLADDIIFALKQNAVMLEIWIWQFAMVVLYIVCTFVLCSVAVHTIPRDQFNSHSNPKVKSMGISDKFPQVLSNFLLHKMVWCLPFNLNEFVKCKTSWKG